jgi:hypothetical protein
MRAVRVIPGQARATMPKRIAKTNGRTSPRVSDVLAASGRYVL